jgi:hypothetical protein
MERMDRSQMNAAESLILFTHFDTRNLLSLITTMTFLQDLQHWA